jgi:hypothetical protein
MTSTANLLVNETSLTLNLPARRKVKCDLRRSVAGDGRADHGWWAVGGVERVESLFELVELLLCLLQLVEPPCDLIETVRDEVGDVMAGGATAVADLEDLADLAQRQPGRPGDSAL